MRTSAFRNATSRLPASTLEKLRSLRTELGAMATARLIGTNDWQLHNLLTGGSVMAATAKRIGEAVERVTHRRDDEAGAG